MKEIKEIARDIREMLQDAECYAREAVKHKDQYPELARLYNLISSNRINEINSLHDQAAAMIDRARREGKEVPEAMTAVWEWEHDNMLDEMTDVKRLQDMYKG